MYAFGAALATQTDQFRKVKQSVLVFRFVTWIGHTVWRDTSVDHHGLTYVPVVGIVVHEVGVPKRQPRTLDASTVPEEEMCIL